jgi:Protein of unknown function (DUF3833)
MTPLSRLLGIFATLLLLTSCASVDISDYANEKPALDLSTYFVGKVDAWGTFQDRSGKVVRRFTVEIDCTWQGDVGTLDERFTYSDGTTERRVWTLRKNGKQYIGTAADVVGEARGTVAGNALRWNYVLALPVDGKTYQVDMDDWMYLMDDQILMNKTTMSKFGVYLGEVTLFFKKRPASKKELP